MKGSLSLVLATTLSMASIATPGLAGRRSDSALLLELTATYALAAKNKNRSRLPEGSQPSRTAPRKRHRTSIIGFPNRGRTAIIPH
jgi:hypothetical protein